MRGFHRRVLLTGLGVPLCLMALGVAPCLAQFGGGGGAADVGAAGRRTLRGPGPTKAEPAPPVLPGTKPASEAAQPTQSPANMSPTDALFDAINRGDMAASRDAINRGANLESTNLLGLTPLELAVDLGRNDISILLLSYRPEDNGSAPPPAQTAADTPAGGAPVLARRARRVAVQALAETTAAPGLPRLHAGDGGAPVPQAGFLGFDSYSRVR